VRRIDAHQHFWNFDPVRGAWITDEMAVLRRSFLPEDLVPHLAASGIDGTVAVQTDQSEDETEFLLHLAERHPFVEGVVGWVDLRAPDLSNRLEHFSRFERFRGVRHIAQAEPDDFLDREAVVEGIGLLRDFDLTYDILVYPQQLPSAVSLVERLPDQPFVLDHIAKPRIRDGAMDGWATPMKELAGHANVWCKVSGLVTEADWSRWHPDDMRPYLDVVFEAFGCDRLIFGSDWPVCLLAAEHRQVVELVDGYAGALPQGERDALFGGNAIRFYGLQA
jgi:L-fuconolactonase